jgi:hypothetical protein
MKTLETQATVDEAGELRVIAQAPPGIAPGEHRAVLLLEEAVRASSHPTSKPPLRLKMLDLRGWPAGTTFRREDIYGDDGR